MSNPRNPNRSDRYKILFERSVSIRENPWLRFCRLDRLDHDELAQRAAIGELDPPRNLGKERIVLAAAHVQPGLHARTALPNDDGAAGDDLSAKRFEAEPLCV